MKAKIERMLDYIEIEAPTGGIKARVFTPLNRTVDIFYLGKNAPTLEKWAIALDGDTSNRTNAMNKEFLVRNLLGLSIDLKMVENVLSKIISSFAAFHLKRYRESLNLVDEGYVKTVFKDTYVPQPKYQGKPQLEVLKGGKE